jgi:hypothetical protein
VIPFSRRASESLAASAPIAPALGPFGDRDRDRGDWDRREYYRDRDRDFDRPRRRQRICIEDEDGDIHCRYRGWTMIWRLLGGTCSERAD